MHVHREARHIARTGKWAPEAMFTFLVILSFAMDKNCLKQAFSKNVYWL